MSTRKLDRRLDPGKDLARAKRASLKPKRVNVDFPSWMVQALDQESDRLGVTRQSLIKIWIAERLKKTSA